MHVKILLKKIREERNMTLDQLSKKTGVSASHLNYIEKEEKEPSLSIIIRIALALDIDEKELYEVIR